MLDDAALLRRFASTQAEDDFAEIVQRHLNLVYSAALRQVGGDHQFAEEVTQSVFTDLARKAGSVGNHVSLAGWLYTSAHYAAAKMVRGEQRRRLREQEASQMQQTHTEPSPEPDWEQLQPVIDEAMHALPEADREVILQRYFQRMPFLQIGARHGLTENAARMRAERALDKLRGILARRGVSATTMALAAVLTAQVVIPAPAALAGAVVTTSLTAAVATDAVAGGGLLTVAKLKVLIPSVCAVALLLGVLVQHQVVSRLREENAALRRQQQLSATAEVPAASTSHPRESEDQRRDKLELLRLRGEVARMRRELSAQNALAGQFAESNQIAFPAAPAVEPQINVRARIFAGTDEALTFFQDNSWGIIEPKQMEKLMKHLEESESVALLTSQQVTSLSGRQAQVVSSEVKTNLSTGLVTESGFLVEVLPSFLGGRGLALNLDVIKMTDKPVRTEGISDSSQFFLRVGQTAGNFGVLDGQTVVMARQFEGKRLVAFVTTTLVDAAGYLVHPETGP